MKRKFSLLVFFIGFLLAFFSLFFRGGFHPLAGFSQMPALQGDTWFNSKPLTPNDLKGKVVLVDFWEYTCVNCIRTFPYIKSWYDRYHQYGLVIIGVHTPEFEFAKKPENVRRAVLQFGFKFPVVMDNEYRIWRAFHNQYWPRDFLFDAKGRLRHDHIGEGDYAQTEAYIQKLLHEIHPNAKFPKPLVALTREDTPGAVCYPMTPELYVGYFRGDMGSPEGYRPGEVVDYHDPGKHIDGVVYAEGSWLNEPQSLQHALSTSNRSDYILIKYHAIEVNAVMKPEGGGSFRVYVFQDEKPLPEEDKGKDVRYDEKGESYLPVNQPRMYQVVENRQYGTHELKLSSDSKDFALYSYTFGACTVPKQ